MSRLCLTTTIGFIEGVLRTISLRLTHISHHPKALCLMNTLCMQISLSPAEPGQEAEIPREVFEIISAWPPVAQRWSRPRHWSGAAWAKEVKQVAALAALKADQTACGGVELGAFVRQRVKSEVWNYWRQERVFGRRTVPCASSVGSGPKGWSLAGIDEIPSAEPRPDQRATEREVVALVLMLPQHQRSLVVRRYWLGVAEAEEAQALGVNRSTVHRRMKAALRAMRKQCAIERVAPGL